MTNENNEEVRVPKGRPAFKEAIKEAVKEPEAAKEPEVADATYKITITVVETYDNEERVLERYNKEFTGEGENKVVVTQGGKVLYKKDWRYYNDTGGQQHVDGQQYRTRFLNEPK